LLAVLAHHLEGADEEAAGAAGGVEEAELEGVLRRPACEQLAHGLADDVFNDVARGVIDAAGFADFRLFLNGHAASVRPDDFAEEPLVNGAEDFDRDVVEQVRRFVVAHIRDEAGQPFVADDEFLAEVQLEEVAVEERNVRRRATVQSAEVADHDAPEGILGRSDTAGSEAGGRLFAEFERFLVGPGTVVLVEIPPPGLHEGIQPGAGVNVAVFADAEEEEAVEDALDGFVEAGAFEEVGAVVVLEQVGGEFAAGGVEQAEELGVQGAGAVGLEEPLLAGLALAGGALGQGLDEPVNAAGGDLVAGEQIPDFLRDERKFAEVPGFPEAHEWLVGHGFAADDVELELLEVG
jgi:hypothetical protein